MADFREALWASLPAANRERLRRPGQPFGPELLPALFRFPDTEARAVEQALSTPDTSSHPERLTPARVTAARRLTERALTAFLRAQGLPVPLGYGVEAADNWLAINDRKWAPPRRGLSAPQVDRQTRRLRHLSKALRSLTDIEMTRLGPYLQELRPEGAHPAGEDPFQRAAAECRRLDYAANRALQDLETERPGRGAIPGPERGGVDPLRTDLVLPSSGPPGSSHRSRLRDSGRPFPHLCGSGDRSPRPLSIAGSSRKPHR